MKERISEMIKELEELTHVAPIKYLDPVVKRLQRAVELFRELEKTLS